MTTIADTGTETEQEPKLGQFIMEYIKQFKESPEINGEIETRFKRGQSLDPTLTRMEVEESFFNRSGDTVKEAFWRFYKKHPFEKHEKELSPEFKIKLERYYQQIRKITIAQRRMVYSGDQGKLQEDDIQRSIAHSEAAEQLVKEGISPNITLARLIVHFIAITDGLDTPDPDRDEKRREAIRGGF